MKIRKILILATFFFQIILTESIYSNEIPELILKASELYNSERKQIQNYRVVQNIASEINSETEKTIEKRNQIGYFISPNKFIFLVKEKSINGQKIQIQSNKPENSKKNDLNWLFSGIIQNYIFKKFDSNGSSQKFHVRPKSNFPDAYEGEIWINENNAKIIRIIKQPVILQKGFEKYKTEIFFETTLPFQEPSYTKLNAIFYSPEGKKVEARVEAIFTNYLFNFDMNNWKE